MLRSKKNHLVVSSICVAALFTLLALPHLRVAVIPRVSTTLVMDLPAQLHHGQSLVSGSLMSGSTVANIGISIRQRKGAGRIEIATSTNGQFTFTASCGSSYELSYGTVIQRIFFTASCTKDELLIFNGTTFFPDGPLLQLFSSVQGIERIFRTSVQANKRAQAPEASKLNAKVVSSRSMADAGLKNPFWLSPGVSICDGACDTLSGKSKEDCLSGMHGIADNYKIFESLRVMKEKLTGGRPICYLDLFNRIDTNGDGLLSATEINSFIGSDIMKPVVDLNPELGAPAQSLVSLMFVFSSPNLENLLQTEIPFSAGQKIGAELETLCKDLDAVKYLGSKFDGACGENLRAIGGCAITPCSHKICEYEACESQSDVTFGLADECTANIQCAPTPTPTPKSEMPTITPTPDPCVPVGGNANVAKKNQEPCSSFVPNPPPGSSLYAQSKDCEEAIALATVDAERFCAEKFLHGKLENSGVTNEQCVDNGTTCTATIAGKCCPGSPKFTPTPVKTNTPTSIPTNAPTIIPSRVTVVTFTPKVTMTPVPQIRIHTPTPTATPTFGASSSFGASSTK